MEDMTNKDAEYLVRRHELHVARQFMPDLCHALIASSDAGLVKSIQALLRVIFGYKPEIKTVGTAGGVLDGLNENAPDITFIDDALFSKNGINLISFLRQSQHPARLVVFTRKKRPADILAIKQSGVADVIHPARIDSARLTESYIRSCVLTVLDAQLSEKLQIGAAEIIALEPRSTVPLGNKHKARILA